MVNLLQKARPRLWKAEGVSRCMDTYTRGSLKDPSGIYTRLYTRLGFSGLGIFHFKSAFRSQAARVTLGRRSSRRPPLNGSGGVERRLYFASQPTINGVTPAALEGVLTHETLLDTNNSKAVVLNQSNLRTRVKKFISHCKPCDNQSRKNP